MERGKRIMYKLVIKQKNQSNYTENHFYYSENIDELFEMVKMSSKLSMHEITYQIREIEEGQIEDED